MLGEIAVPWSGEGEAAGQNGRDVSLVSRRLHFSPARGFMRGFMDLVFCWGGRYYLVDWKSNHLGDRVSDYGPVTLSGVMRDNYYVLQYHLYCLALHLYLGARLRGYRYDSHFGGAYYFFLRGLDPAAGPEYGIYRDRPPEQLITDLAAKMIARF
jgi:exodeoxyribonuclease V beta subunit